MSIIIRNPLETECANILELMRRFAEFERLSEYLTISVEAIRNNIFCDDSFVEALVAADDGDIIGYAFFYPHFSSFRGQSGYYLEDIYIDTAYRGKGIGEAMLKEIARMGRSRGFMRIDFQVLEWNTPAIDFYKKMGAACDEVERHFKFTDDAFISLAS